MNLRQSLERVGLKPLVLKLYQERLYITHMCSEQMPHVRLGFNITKLSTAPHPESTINKAGRNTQEEDYPTSVTCATDVG